MLIMAPFPLVEYMCVGVPNITCVFYDCSVFVTRFLFDISHGCVLHVRVRVISVSALLNFVHDLYSQYDLQLPYRMADFRSTPFD